MGPSAGVELLEMLGIEIDRVRKATIIIEPGKSVVALVERFTKWDRLASRAIAVGERYEVTLKDKVTL